MTLRTKRIGVASILGTIVFVVVFMLALGSLAFASSLQTQASQAEQQAQLVAATKGSEVVGYGLGPSGLVATNGGPVTVSVNHLIMKFPNGTVYSLRASAIVSTGSQVAVQTLVPAGVCSPGTATCSSKYNQIVSGNPTGSEVGLVTSLGNVFWYAPDPGGGISGWTRVSILSSGTWTVPGGVSSVYILCMGGGGGGGGSGGATYNSGMAANGGGGGGGVGSLVQGFVTLNGASSVPITVGTGGSAGSAGGVSTNGGSGGNGGTGSFGSYLSCGGGQGGGGSTYNINGGTGPSCSPSNPAAGGAGAGIPGGVPTLTGTATNALQQTVYGGGGGGGSAWNAPPGAGSPSASLTSGAIYTGSPGTSGSCATGGGGGSASPFGNGGAGGNAATSCGSGQAGGAAAANSGAGGGGAGGSVSTTLACGTKGGQPGGVGGSGQVVVYYQ